MVLLEEAETHQGIMALRRVQEEIVDIPPPRYSLACFPVDANKEEALLELLEDRIAQIRRSSVAGPAVNCGDAILPLLN